MGALALPAGAAAVGAFLCLAAAWLWLTQGAPAATKFIEGVRQSIDEAFSESEPSPVEDCPLSEEGPIEPSGPPPELPPGGTPEPPIDVTLPLIAIAAGLAGEKKKPVKPTDLSESDDKLWDSCSALHDKYKATQGSIASKASRVKELLSKVNSGKGTPEDKEELCALLEQQINEADQLYRERKEYIDMDCDKFPWFPESGKTEEQRRNSHQGELENVGRQIENLEKLKNRFCS